MTGIFNNYRQLIILLAFLTIAACKRTTQPYGGLEDQKEKTLSSGVQIDSAVQFNPISE
ncbi:MAG TPA: hypothetical protein PKD37_01095 [Oligoflexia bacterium]|nr:hypothetical protein [Oligoflexia bacterium]HMP26575.1 hypothetical protein [Oligoflexia bacterium]